MPLYALGELVPRIHPDAFVHPEAVIIGDVEIGALSSVWPGAVLRGDDGDILVGERTSIQDGVIVHTWDEHPTRIGSGCVIGHLAHLEGCRIGDDVLIGSGAIVLRRAIVEAGSLVGGGGTGAAGQGRARRAPRRSACPCRSARARPTWRTSATRPTSTSSASRATRPASAASAERARRSPSCASPATRRVRRSSTSGRAGTAGSARPRTRPGTRAGPTPGGRPHGAARAG